MKKTQLTLVLVLSEILLILLLSQMGKAQNNTNILKGTEENPIAHFTVHDPVCAKDSAFFINQSTGDYTSIYWNFGDGIDAGAWERPFHIYEEAGQYDVVLTLTLDKGNGTKVVDTAKISITVLPAPPLEIVASDTVIYEGGSVSLTAIGDFTDVVWNYKNLKETTIEVNKAGSYTVQVTDQAGCRAWATSKYLTTISGNSGDGIVVINNILTPNGDGINDALMIENKAYYNEPISVEIFNAWGIKVFNSSDYRNETWKGENVDGGTHYYIIKCASKKGISGFIDVIK